MLTYLDHPIVVVRDLDAATERAAALLGREPSWRGSHPGAGTANALFRLENVYLELLAARGEGGVGDLLRARLDAGGEGLLGLAFATDDAEACRREWLARGLHPGEPSPGRGRERDSGAEREWTTLLLPASETRGVVVFAIEHRSPPERLPAAPVTGDPAAAVAGLDHVVLRTADPEACRELYGQALGLRLALDRSFEDWGVRLLFFRLAGLTVEVAASLKPEPGTASDSDQLWGLSYRVPDVAAARERVAAAGFDVSEVRGGRKPGTRVCTVCGEPLGVATLLIGPEA